MPIAELNSAQIATVAGDITVFNYDGVTREYISSSVEYLPIGVGIPANSCIDAPYEVKDKFAICRVLDSANWEYVADHRGETVYSTVTGEKIILTALGHYPENTTTQSPLTPYDTWSGSEWVTDTKAQKAAEVEAAEQQRATLLAEAQTTISLWQTQLQLNIISDEDKACLIDWINYIKLVQMLDTSIPAHINWPPKPSN